MLELLGMNATVPTCEFYKQDNLLIKFILTSCFGTIVCLFGMIGNLLIFLTLSCVSNRTANKLYLIQMSLCDITLLFCAVMLYGVEHFAEFYDIPCLYNTWVSYLPFLYGVGHCAQLCGVGLLFIGCLERYLDIAYGRRFKNLLGTKKSAAIAILVNYVLLISLCIPRFFEITSTVRKDCRGLGSRTPAASDMTMSTLYQTIYGLWICSVGVVVIPFMIILVLNILTIRHMRIGIRRQFRRRKMAVSKKRCTSVGRSSWQAAMKEFYDRSILRKTTKERIAAIADPISTRQVDSSDPSTREATTTFAAFVTVFLVSNSWAVVLTAVECVGGAEFLTRVPLFYSASREIINICAVLGPAVTFIIYWMFSLEFRADFHTGCRRVRSLTQLNNRIEAETENVGNRSEIDNQVPLMQSQNGYEMKITTRSE